MRAFNSSTKFLAVAIFLIQVLCPAQTLVKEQESEVLDVTKRFWVAFCLGDLEDAAALAREEDSKIIPQAKGEGAEMMKMKDLPQLAGIRREMESACLKAFAFAEPQFAQDGIAATVSLSPNAEDILPFYELKVVYETYMAKAYYEKKAGREVPSLEVVKAGVLAKDSPQRNRIQRLATGVQKEKSREVPLQKTQKGWRVNIESLFSKK